MIEVKGVESTILKLDNIQKNVVKAAIRKGSRAGCKIIQSQAKEDAPKGTGALRQAIKVRALPRSRKYVGTRVTLAIKYGSFVNYGTKYQTAQRFLNDTAKQTKTRAVDTAVDIIVQELMDKAGK